MRTQNILILILLILPLGLFSQDKFTVRSPYPVVDAGSKNYFNKGDEILTVKIHGKKVFMQRFNTSNSNLPKINISIMPDGFSLERVLELNNKYYLFYSLWDGANKKEQLYSREIDFDSGKFMDKEKLLVKVNGKITGSVAAVVSGGFGWIFGGIVDKFDFQYSQDYSKLMITYRLKPDIKNDAKNFDKIGMYVFSNNLDPIWNQEVVMPYTEKKMNNIDYSIDNKGNTYILATVFEDIEPKAKKNSDEPNYHIELLKVNAKTQEMEKSVIKLNNMFIKSVWLYESPKGKMVCAGFYNKGINSKSTDGILICNIDKKGEVIDIRSYEIPVKILNMYQSAKIQKKNNKKDEKAVAEFENLKLRNVYFEDDGSIVLVGEQHFITSHTTCNSKGNCRTTYVYHYNDILVTKIDSKGELAWMQKLPKRQRGGNGKGGMGFKFISGDNNYNFLFLDNEKNLDLSMNEIPALHHDGAGGFLTLYKVDKDFGNVSKVSIVNFKAVKLAKDAKKGQPVYQFSTSRILPLSRKQFAFEVYKKKKQDVLIKVDL
ncbi:MAG: hypothetical protein H0V01_08965 [Bacteroidetes bacterium]|nr:hypothetical protein [Bacteroidota bacterium]HET6244621.1 hypothetical protein [Bacteroidia bacterium]